MEAFGTKRLRFLISSALLTAILIILSLSMYRDQFYLVLVPSAASILLTSLVLGGFRGVEVVTLPLLPFLFTLGTALIQYFYPNFHLFVQVAGWLVYFAVFYILLLALNVFKVEHLRAEAIPLDKAAKPAIFLLVFLVALLMLTAIYKFGFGVPTNIVMVFGLVFLLALDAFWFLTLSDLLERRFFAGAATVGLALVQISLAFSFFPWKAHLRGLSEAVFFYAALGVSRAYFERHLKLSIVLEYVLVSLAVFLFARFI